MGWWGIAKGIELYTCDDACDDDDGNDDDDNVDDDGDDGDDADDSLGWTMGDDG